MGKWVNVSEVNNIVGKALEACKDELSPSFYCGARLILDKINEMAEEIADTPQTEEKHAICNGCVYCDLPNAFHPCASCVDFSKYVGEESGDTPQTDVYDYKGNGKWERSE